MKCPAGTSTYVLYPAGTLSLQSGANSSSVCVTCGSGSTSVQGASGAGACMCVLGFYMNAGSGQCVPCERCYWCSAGVRTACPGLADGKSTSPPRSSAAEHCLCRPGYYGLDYWGTGCLDCPENAYCTGEQGDNDYGKKFDSL